MNAKKTNIILFIGIQVLCILALIWPALLNGFPLLFPDSGAYIASGHSGEVPIDRPIVYGLFVRHISLSWSLWLVILIQSLLFNYLIHLFSKYFLKAKKPVIMQLYLIGFLALASGLPYYSSIILADLFAPIGLLCLFLLLVLKPNAKKHLILLSLLLLFSSITHLSHIPLIVGVLFALILFLWILNKNYLKEKFSRLILIAGLILASVLSLGSINYFHGAGFTLSRSNNIILATRLIESGIANRHLKQHCVELEDPAIYDNLCDYIDQFEQWPAAGFYLYDFSSPLYQGKCLDSNWTHCWMSKNEAYGRLIEDILADPKLRMEYLKLAFNGMLKQALTFEQSGLAPVDFEELIAWHFDSDIEAFRQSNQYAANIDFKVLSAIELVMVILSFLMAIILGVLHWRKIAFEGKALFFIILTGLITNALLTSTLSNVIPRYQGRIIFLLPLVIILLIIKTLTERKKNMRAD